MILCPLILSIPTHKTMGHRIMAPSRRTERPSDGSVAYKTQRGKPATQTEFSHGWNTDGTRIKRVQQVRKQSEPSCQPQPISAVASPCFIRFIRG